MNDNMMDLLHKANVEREKLNRENVQLKNILDRAVHELCDLCGRRPDESIGACDRCPWHPVTKGKLI